jgi:hypothetical protein
VPCASPAVPVGWHDATEGQGALGLRRGPTRCRPQAQLADDDGDGYGDSALRDQGQGQEQGQAAAQGQEPLADEPCSLAQLLQRAAREGRALRVAGAQRPPGRRRDDAAAAEGNAADGPARPDAEVATPAPSAPGPAAAAEGPGRGRGKEGRGRD